MSNNHISPRVIAEAGRGLTIYVENKKLSATLTEIKGTLVDAADGDTLSITIPGQGKVIVTKPSEAEPVPGEFTFVFSQAAFDAAQPATRKALMDKGIVLKVPKTSGGSSAAVRYLPNT